MAYKKIDEPIRQRDNPHTEVPTVCIRKSQHIGGKLLPSRGIYFTFMAVDECRLRAGMLFAVEVDETAKKIKLRRMRRDTKPNLKYVKLHKHGIELSQQGNLRVSAVMGQLFKGLGVIAPSTIRKEIKILNREEFEFSYNTEN